MREATRGSRSSGIDALMVGGRRVTMASRFSSIPASSFSIGVTNLSTPSRSSLAVTSSRSIPASSSARRSSVGSCAPLPGWTSACSAAAVSVAIGIVLTVCGATSWSTYIVSG